MWASFCWRTIWLAWCGLWSVVDVAQSGLGVSHSLWSVGAGAGFTSLIAQQTRAVLLLTDCVIAYCFEYYYIIKHKLATLPVRYSTSLIKWSSLVPHHWAVRGAGEGGGRKWGSGGGRGGVVGFCVTSLHAPLGSEGKQWGSVTTPSTGQRDCGVVARC